MTRRWSVIFNPLSIQICSRREIIPTSAVQIPGGKLYPKPQSGAYGQSRMARMRRPRVGSIGEQFSSARRHVPGAVRFVLLVAAACARAEADFLGELAA